jgi:hypothetical protein
MTSVSGTPTLLHNGRFDGISDTINWSVSILPRLPARNKNDCDCERKGRGGGSYCVAQLCT